MVQRLVQSYNIPLRTVREVRVAVIIGPIRLQMKYKGRQVEWSFSSEKQTVEGVQIPTWIEQRQLGGSGPDTFIRVELRDGSPQVVQLSFTSEQHQSEVQQKHLRSVDVDRFGNRSVCPLDRRRIHRTGGFS